MDSLKKWHMQELKKLIEQTNDYNLSTLLTEISANLNGSRFKSVPVAPPVGQFRTFLLDRLKFLKRPKAERKAAKSG